MGCLLDCRLYIQNVSRMDLQKNSHKKRPVINRPFYLSFYYASEVSQIKISKGDFVFIDAYYDTERGVFF